MRQQVIYSMMAMAVAPAFSYAAITSTEVASRGSLSGLTTELKDVFTDLNLAPGSYQIKTGVNTGTGSRLNFFLYENGVEVKAIGGNTSAGTSKTIAFTVEKSGVYTIKVKQQSGSDGYLNNTPKVELQFDWTENAELNAFQANVLDYINDISAYQTPDKDTNVDLNTCKQTAVIDWSVAGNQTYANYVTYKLYAFSGVTLADGEKNLTTMFTEAKKTINGAEAVIWLDKAQTLLDNFKAGGAVYDKVAALQADGAELQYADVLGLEDNSKWEEAAKKAVSVKTLATELLAAFAADGGEQKAVQDFYDEINADKEATFNATEFEKKIKGDGTGTLEKAVKLALDKATLLEGLQKWMVDAGVPSAEGLVKFEELVDEFDAALTTMPIVSERSAGVWRHAASRLRGQVYKVQVAVEKALEVYTAQLLEEVPTWKNPKGFTVSVPKITIDGSDYGSKNYTISSMGASVLGLADADPAAHYYALKDANYTIRHGIAFMKWFKINNEQAYEDAVEAVDKAKKKYNKEIQRLELAIQELDAKDPNTSANNDQYAELLEKAKTALLPVYKDVLDTYYKEEEVDGNKVITGTIYATRIAGGDIGTQTTHNPQTFYLNDDASARVNNVGPARVPSEVWQDEITNLTTDLGTAVDAWIAKAQNAYNRFKDLNTLVNGEANDGELKHDLAATGFSAIPAELKKIAVYTDLKAQNDKIEAHIQALGEALTEANKTLNETGDDMVINSDDWNKTNADSKFWNKKEVTDPEFVTYAEIADEITALKAAVDAATAEYNAWQKLLADADDLADRLKTASEALTATTAAIKNPAYNPADYYGYKGIGDNAAQNTKMAKMITDYVAALKAKANEVYGDGNGTGAQTLLAEAPAYTDDQTAALLGKPVVFAPADEDDVNTDVTANLPAGKYKLGINLTGYTGDSGSFQVYVKAGSKTFEANHPYFEPLGITEGTVSFELTETTDITVNIPIVSNYSAGQTANFDFTLMKADGSTFGYQDTPLVDTDKDADTDPDFTWKLADTDIKLLETGGAIATAVDNWLAFRTAVAHDQEDIVAFFNQTVNGVKVNEHGIYTDDNHWYADNALGNKYKTNEDEWQKHIKEKGTNVIETNEALDAKAHFDAIGLVAPYALFDIEDQLKMTESDGPAEIAKDMADYDAAAQLKLATDLNDQLAGTDGYIAEAQQAWQDAFDEVYTNDADFWTKYDADTQVWGTNTITGNTNTLEGMWNAMKAAIEKVENDRADIEALPMDKGNASDSWNALSALKKQLDMFTSSEEAEGEPTVANCIAKLKEYTERIKEGLKLNYDTYKEFVNNDVDNLGKVNQLYKAIGESHDEVVGYVFIAANGETLDYENKYQDLENTYALNVENNIKDAYEDFYNFELVEYDEAAKEWKATALYGVSETHIAEAYIRLEVLDEYVETYDEYLHVNTALNGDGTITAAIAEYAKKYGNPDGAFVELASDEDVYGTAAARANFEAMLTALNTASGKPVANLTGEEANLKDIETLLGSDRTAFDKDDFDKAGLLLSEMLETLEKLGGLTAEEGENYSTFKGESMAERKYDFLIQGILEQAKDNQKAYDNILDIKQKLSDAVKKALEELAAQKDVSYEDENGNTVDPKADLIKDIKDNYEPLPTNLSAAILASYEAGQSVAQDVDTPEPADAADRQYYKLKNAFDELAEKLTKWASEGYAAAITAKNADTYSDAISTLYMEAMAKYNKAVADVKEFKTPEYESLKDAYEAQILTLNNGLYKAPEQLLDARKNAQDNVNTANTNGELYDAAPDVAAIQNIINNTIDASFNTFITNMKTAAQAAWDAVKGDLQTAIDDAKNEVNTEGYFASLDETKDGEGNVTAQVGVNYDPTDADADGMPDAIAALFQAQQDIYDAADALTDLEDAGNPAYGEFLKLDRMLTGKVQAGEEAIASIVPGVKTKLNEVANTDLTVRAQLTNGAALIAGTVLGDKATMEGKGAVINYNGKDYQYTYKQAVDALAETTSKDWKSFTDRFDALVAATYTAAVNLQNTYNTAEQLPSATIDEVLTNTRQNVIDLLNLFDGGNLEIESFATIIGEIETIYDQYTSDMAYNVELALLEEDFATEAAGIKNLYVGENYVGQLNALKAAIAAEKESKTNLTTVNGLRDQLNTLVADAKAAERTKLATELMKMEGEYNDLIGNVYKDDAAKKEELIAKFATPGDKLNIVENENTVSGYDETNTYDEYLAIEKNLALIKTEIGKEIYEVDPTNELAVSPEMLAKMVTDLENALAACEDYESEYLAGQKLFDPKNPEMGEGFYLEDFGLYSYYLADDYKNMLEQVAVVKEAFGVIKTNLAKYKEEGTILLYNEKLTTELENAKNSLKDIDAQFNDPDKAASLYALNKAELDKAAEWNATYLAQQAVIDAFATFDDEGNVTAGTLKEAIDRIEELGETWTTTPTLATVIERIAIVQDRLTGLYLCGLLPANYDVNGSHGSNSGNKPTYKDNAVTYNIPVQWYGLTTLGNNATAAVDAAALSHAQKKLADVTAVYDAVEDKLANTKMRAADKEAMLLKLADFKAELDDLALTGGVWQGEGVALTDANVEDYDAAVKALKDKLATDISIDPETGDLIVDGGFVDEIEADLVGDLNNEDGTGDGVVDVDDLDILLGYVTDGVPADDPNYDKIFAAADLNNDKVIDISDALILIDMITNQDVSEYVQARSAQGFTETATATVESVNGNRQRIAISLNNWRQYAAFQMDVQLPKGMTIVGQELSDRASGKTMLIGQPNGKTRFVAYDMEKTALTGNNGAVLYIDVETNDSFRGGDIKYSNIIFATTESVGVRFYIGDSETTGIRTTKLDAAKQTIYNMGGRVMETLKKGVNILRGENGETEKVIKK